MRRKRRKKSKAVSRAFSRGRAWRVWVHARVPSWCGAHACLGEVYALGGPHEWASVTVSLCLLSLSVPRASASSIADFLTLSLTASLCLSPSVRLSCRLSPSLVPPLSPFFSETPLSLLPLPAAPPRSPRAPSPVPRPSSSCSLAHSLSFAVSHRQIYGQPRASHWPSADRT